MANDFESDVALVQSIEAVPSILDIVCRMTGMGFAAVARVTEGRWVACSVMDAIGFGLKPGGELTLETTICHEIRESREPVVIDNVAEDAVFRGHPTPALYGFQSYISIPIVMPDGEFFGTLCAIDPKPAALGRPETVGAFRLFAELIAHHLDTQRRLDASEAELLDARKTAELREVFIGVLGHDLRNPLAAVSSGISLIGRTPLNERATKVLTMMQQSVLRMNELITNVLDFTRGRLGGGINLRRNADLPLVPVLDQVVGELRYSWPEREIETRFVLEEAVDCDRDRIGQMFSNLLSNAITHGADGQPIRTGASVQDGEFVLWVANGGAAIPPEMLPRLFEPFARGADGANQQGLGLGLHIAAEIARAHGGRLWATSSEEKTCFTFAMPMRAG